MPKVDKKLLLSKIAASKQEVLDAEKRLTKVLHATTRSPRAEKTTIAENVKEAIASLRAARLDLAELGRLVSDDG
jgi:hypothetical protein